jgi:predicted phosphoribosyltransferase
MKAQQGTVRIVSKSGEPFSDRVEAGRLLAVELEEYGGKKAVILGIPRGGVIIAEEIARRLSADMDIVLTHKLGAPYNCELAIGAVCEDGTHFVNEPVANYVGADDRYISQEKARQLKEINRKVSLYRPVLAKLPLEGRIVIAVDDGVATGATMQAALWAIRKGNPAKVLMAVPVGPQDSIMKLSGDADETVCLRTPYDFQALGRFYLEFPQVEDEQLLAILKEESNRRTAQ